MIKKIAISMASLAGVVVLNVGAASAHVIVTPAQVGIGAFQVFSTSVPNEKDSATTAVKLLIPSGLGYVLPTVKPGWTISEVETGSGDNANVSEIDWTGGSIPVGQRDDFTFNAQTPAKPTSLHWKAYQTYADGTVVHWDETPTGSFTDGSTPYSTTKVVNDLTAATTTAPTTQAGSDMSSGKLNLALGLGVLGIVLSAASLIVKRNEHS